MDAVRWLLVGAGDIATRRVAPALAEAANSKLAAVCDIDAGKAAGLADRHGVGAVFASLPDALAGCDADAVYVATPQHTHIELSLQVLAARRHPLCEKPLAVNGAACLPLLEAARASDRVASCSNYRRLSEQVKLTARMLQRQEIGRLVGGWAVYSTPFWNPGQAPIRRELGMSRIKELGYYLIDIVQNALGMPAVVMAQASTIDKAKMNDVDDISTVVLKFPDGAIFTIIFNCHSPGTRHELEFFGTEGRIYWPAWPPHGNGPVVRTTRSGTETFDARTNANWHLPMIEDYVDALLTGREPVCTLESAARTEFITDAIFRAIDSGKEEAVDTGQFDMEIP